ncbi:fibronectin type III domain-containing protein [Jiangella ureilytica]|nr:fibronectin type III domain-containing protein [Jiangella ureilytica]
MRDNLRRILAVVCASAAIAVMSGGTTQAAPPPTGVRITETGFDTISLAWSPVSDAEFYRVLVNGVWRAGVYSPEIATTVTQLSPGTTYVIEVQARTADGDFGPSATLRTSTLDDAEPPTTPTGLHETRDSTGRWTGLTWNASTDNWKVGSYRLYANGRLTLIGGDVAEPWRLTDPYHGGLTCGATYEFTVEAIDWSGNTSARSDPLTATIPPCGAAASF